MTFINALIFPKIHNRLLDNDIHKCPDIYFLKYIFDNDINSTYLRPILSDWTFFESSVFKEGRVVGEPPKQRFPKQLRWLR
jgi:hypothetical protein